MTWSIFEMEGGKKWIRSSVYGTIVGVIIFSIILAWAGLQDVWLQAGEVNPFYLAIYVGFMIGIYVLRAWRFQLLIGINGSISKLYGVVSVHNLMVNLLPLSGGELTYPFLLKHCGISSRFSEGIPSIVLARFQDLLISGLLLVAALTWLRRFGELGVPAAVMVVKVIGLCLLVVIGGILFYHLRVKKIAIVLKFRVLLTEVFASIKKISRGVWLGSFVIALAGRLASIVATFYLVQAVGVVLPFPVVFLICSAYVFLPLLPINTPAGLGITEAFLVVFFVASGIDEKVAAVASIHVHFLQLIVAASLGVIGTLQLQYLRYYKRQPAIL